MFSMAFLSTAKMDNSSFISGKMISSDRSKYRNFGLLLRICRLQGVQNLQSFKVEHFFYMLLKIST